MQLTIINHFDALFCFCLTGITLLSGPLQPLAPFVGVCRNTNEVPLTTEFLTSSDNPANDGKLSSESQAQRRVHPESSA